MSNEFFSSHILESTSDETETTDVLDATMDALISLIPESVLELDMEQQQVEHSAKSVLTPVSCSI